MAIASSHDCFLAEMESYVVSIHQKTSSVTGGLHFKHGGVAAAERHQLLVVAFFHQAAAFEDDDAVGHANG